MNFTPAAFNGTLVNIHPSTLTGLSDFDVIRTYCGGLNSLLLYAVIAALTAIIMKEVFEKTILKKHPSLKRLFDIIFFSINTGSLLFILIIILKTR